MLVSACRCNLSEDVSRSGRAQGVSSPLTRVSLMSVPANVGTLPRLVAPLSDLPRADPVGFSLPLRSQPCCEGLLLRPERFVDGRLSRAGAERQTSTEKPRRGKLSSLFLLPDRYPRDSHLKQVPPIPLTLGFGEAVLGFDGQGCRRAAPRRPARNLRRPGFFLPALSLTLVSAVFCPIGQSDGSEDASDRSKPEDDLPVRGLPTIQPPGLSLLHLHRFDDDAGLQTHQGAANNRTLASNASERTAFSLGKNSSVVRPGSVGFG